MQITPEREVIVSCRALSMEFEHIQEQTGIVRPIVYVDRGLHNFPDRLRAAVQEKLDSLEDVDRVLMGYANCGNAISGVVSRDFELIIPRVDDCVSILFNSMEARIAYSKEHASMFMTEGWMDAEHSIVAEYEQCVEDYGEEEAAEITEMMYAHYRTMTYLDTGLYDIEALKRKVRVICDIAELADRVEPVELTYLEQLVAGPWPDDRFIRIPPNTEVPTF